MNPFINHFDPALHTFNHVRQRSLLLLSAILAAAAKTFHPSLHATLRDHAELLFTRSFRRGRKTTETVQAILVLTYWKEPDDTRAWLSVGYAIRICFELGWHKLAMQPAKEAGSKMEIERREARNIERTWLVLFVYDRR